MARGKQPRRPRSGSRAGGGLSKGWTWATLAMAVLGFLLYVLGSGPEGPGGIPPADEGRIAEGGALYERNCAACHGPGARGQLPERPMGGRLGAGVPIAPALNGSGHAWHHPPEMLFRIIRDGSPVAGSPMKGWEERMSDGEIRAVLDYLYSLWPASLRERYDRSMRTR